MTTPIIGHAGYRELAERALPGGALGTRLNPEGLRFTVADAAGSWITDVEGERWLDYIMGAGALILGHQPPQVVEAVRRQAGRTIHQYGSLTDVAIELAAVLVDAIPCAERILFATTGSEATAYAMRMARAATGRDQIIKFEGAFHGNHDYAGVGVSPPEPSHYPQATSFTQGTPEAVRGTMSIVPYNDLEALERIIAPQVDEVAGIIVEPVQRIIEPAPGFLEGLRRYCDRHDIVLIFDEVVTGFRLSRQGAQGVFGVTPDLATYGKIVGGGMALSCVAGRADLIDQAHPGRKATAGYVYASGTQHGNPLAAAAGLATLSHLEDPAVYDDLEARTSRLAAALTEVLERRERRALVATVGSLWQILHIDAPPQSYLDLLRSDQHANAALDTALLHERINVTPNLRRFVGLSHTDDEFTRTAEALDRALR